MSTKTILEEAAGEIVEKKSRFIAHLIHAETEVEAEAFLAAEKKKYYDARHHCSAWILDGDPVLERSNDDGEPSGSAGRPMLEVLKGADLTNVCVVVTRYFGGTLLGVGGLVRAYSGAVRAALENADPVEVFSGISLLVTSDYNDEGRLSYYFRQRDTIILNTVYNERVTTELLLPENEVEGAIRKIQDLTNGRATVQEAGRKQTYI